MTEEWPPGSFTLCCPGREDQEFESWDEAVRAFVSCEGDATLIDPSGEVIVSRGQPLSPEG